MISAPLVVMKVVTVVKVAVVVSVVKFKVL